MRFPRASGDEPGSGKRLDALEDVFPARAGMSPVISGTVGLAFRFPRASGDEPRVISFLVLDTRFSPRERG